MRKLLSTITITLAALSACAFLASCGPQEDPEVAVSSVTLNESSVALEIGGTTRLTATVNPSNATDKVVRWSSSNQGVATVDNGTVTSLAQGSATITATAGGKSGTCQVTVNKKVVEVSSVTLDNTEAKLEIGETLTLKATVSPSDATDPAVTWESDNKDVATVDASGKVTAVKAGSATITAKAGGKSATCKVTVKNLVVVESIELDKTELSLDRGEEAILVATVKPDDAADKTVKWESNRPGFVSVDQNGKLTSLNYGEAVITAKAGDKTASCVVKVVDKTELRIKETLIELYNALDGPNWKRQENWGTDEWLGNWEGVQYTNNVNGCKLELFFNDFGLKGEIPECVGDLTELTRLFIQNEPNVTGTLPQSFGKLSILETLHIEKTSMTSLADVFAPDNKLKWVFIFNNPEMTGPLPENLGASDELITFAFINNAFTGTVPESWARLCYYDRLTEGLNINGNRLSGQIPKSFLEGTRDEVAFKLEQTGLLNQIGEGFDISGIDIPGYWPVSPIEDMVSGKSFRFDEVVSKNKYTVYLNWAPWCPMSKALLPQLLDYYKKYRQEGLEIIATVTTAQNGGFWTDREWQLRDIKDKGYGIWYNFYYEP